MGHAIHTAHSEQRRKKGHEESAEKKSKTVIIPFLIITL